MMQAIHRAAKECDVDALRRELARGVDPDLAMASPWPTNPRVYLILVSAGAEVPEAYHPYIERIIDAGDWETYRRHHLDQLTAMLTPKDQTDRRRRSRRRLSPLRRLPPELLRKIVAYAFHAGYY